MVSRLGVIPAAGQGSRWGGYYKELLPCGEGEWLLDRTVRAMQRGGADAVLVVTRPEKVAPHSAHLTGIVDIPVFYAMQQGDNDIWSAIEESFNYPADDYLFAMPDTYFPLDGFLRGGYYPIFLGLFDTSTPERFGVLSENRRKVINKQQMKPGIYKAWGLLSWTSRTVEVWRDNPPKDYTHAINMLIEHGTKPATLNLDYYYDFATFSDYQKFIRSHNNGRVLVDDFTRYTTSMPVVGWES